MFASIRRVSLHFVFWGKSRFLWMSVASGDDDVDANLSLTMYYIRTTSHQRHRTNVTAHISAEQRSSVSHTGMMRGSMDERSRDHILSSMLVTKENEGMSCATGQGS